MASNHFVRRTITARSSDEIGHLRYAWERLEKNSSATMFQSFAWNSVAARVFSEREAPYVIYSESDSGIALLPMAMNKARRRISPLGEMLFDYRDILSAGDDQTLNSAWHRVAQTGLTFSVGGLRPESQLAKSGEFPLKRFYGSPRVSPHEISAEAFASDHDRLGRFYRRLERMGVTLRCRTGADSEFVRAIYRLKGSQPADNGGNLLQDPLRQQFLVEACRAMGSACEIFTLESDGNIIAALVTFRERNVRRFYTIYFDVAWAKHSPGMVLVYELTRRSLKSGIECDYMTGEQGYKIRLATSVVPMYWTEADPAMLSQIAQYRPALAA